jgi:putative flippase GtrA
MRPPAASLVRFAIVGVASNAALYIAYLGLTAAGIGHKIAMTLVFGVGIAVTFVVNRAWSFQSRRRAGGAFARYVMTYVAGYALNLAALVALVDVAGYRHELVQLAMIVVVAVVMFLLQRYWVFAEAPALASHE